METRLYHACKSADAAFAIQDDGFRGADVWEYHDVVFLADRPLVGFGGWRQSWVAVDVPGDVLAQGIYQEGADWDNEQYHAQCYCFQAEVINQFPRRVFLDEVPGVLEDREPTSYE